MAYGRKRFTARKRSVYAGLTYARKRSRRTFLTKAAVRRAALGRFARGFSRVGLAAELGYMAYRSWKGRARRQIGEAPGHGNAKREVVFEQSITNRDTRTLYSHPLTEIDQGTNINERERRLANIRGWKICMEVKNLRNIPLYVNIAILCPKAGTLSSGTSVTDFFRASQGPDRAVDFDTNLSGLEFHCLPINTDRYAILKHKRTRLVAMASGGDTVALNGYSYMNVDWYIPLKRQIRYDGATGDKIEAGKTFLVYWFDGFSTNAVTAAVVAAAQTSVRAVAYFRDPK